MTRLIALCLPLAAMPALAEAPALRGADRDRLARLDEAVGRALLSALAEGSPRDVAELAGALAGVAGPPAPEGDWACRTIKAGGPVPLVVYTPFACRITRLGPTEWRFEKLTGSQRSSGIIALDEGRAIYRGVGFSGAAPATGYAGLPETQAPVAPAQTVPQVAVFEQTGPGRARLMFPYPVLESEFDILELTR